LHDFPQPRGSHPAEPNGLVKGLAGTGNDQGLIGVMQPEVQGVFVGDSHGVVALGRRVNIVETEGLRC
jgi:hypothetical protein